MGVSGARRFGARWFHRRPSSDPRVAWRRLPVDVRSEVLELAWRGQPSPYASVRETAVAWAAAIAAVPFMVAWTRGLGPVVASVVTATIFFLVVNHNPLPFTLISAVAGMAGLTLQLLLTRNRARRVLRANQGV